MSNQATDTTVKANTKTVTSARTAVRSSTIGKVPNMVNTSPDKTPVSDFTVKASPFKGQNGAKVANMPYSPVDISPDRTPVSKYTKKI